MLLQEVPQSDTKTDGDGNMLANNGYRSGICCYKGEGVNFATIIFKIF